MYVSKSFNKNQCSLLGHTGVHAPYIVTYMGVDSKYGLIRLIWKINNRLSIVILIIDSVLRYALILLTISEQV